MAEQGVSVADLIATLKLDISQFQTAVQQLDQNLSKMRSGLAGAAAPAGDLQDALDKAAGSAAALGVQGGLLGSVIGFLTNPLTLAGAAMAGFGLAMDHAKNSATETAIEVRQLMAVSGLSATAADQLGDAFKALGFNSDTLALMMFRMGTEIESGGAGLGRLGVSLKTAGGEAKTEGELFLEVRDKMAAIGSAAERNAALIDVFQRSARQVAPVFDLNREAFVQFLEKAELLHPWSERAQADSIQLVQSQAQLKLAMEGLWSTIGTGLAGPAARFSDWLTSIVVGTRDALKGLKDFMAGAGAFAVTPQGGGVPSAVTTSALTAVPAGPGRPTTADFAAQRALFTQQYQEQVQFYTQVNALRQRDVADQLISESASLQAELANFTTRISNATNYYNQLRDLAVKETGGLSVNNPAGIKAVADIEAQRAATLTQLETARLGVETRIATSLLQQFTVFNEMQLAATRATPALSIDALDRSLAEVNLRFDAAIQRAPAFTNELEALRATTVKTITEHDAFVKSLKGLEVQLDLDEKAASDYQKLVKSLGATFEAASLQAEVFVRSQAVLQQLGGIQRAAGVPGVNISGGLQAGVTSQIGVLLGQQAEWNAELANVDAGSRRFNELTAAIEKSALQVSELRTQLAGLQQVNDLKGWVTDVFGSFERALSTSVTGVIQGTTTMQQAWQKLGQSIVISIEEMLIKRGFKALEDGFNTMLDSMDARAAISTALRFLGSAFGPSAAGSPSAPPLAGEPAVPIAFAEGGIVTQRTLALIGEAGPEAVVPLDHMPGVAPLSMGGGGVVNITIVNNTDSTVQAQDKGTSDGARQIEILVEGTVQRGFTNGRYDKTMQTVFGLSRQGVGR